MREHFLKIHNHTQTQSEQEEEAHKQKKLKEKFIIYIYIYLSINDMFKSIFEPHDPNGAFQEQKKNEKKNNKMTTIKSLVQ